MTKTVTRLNLKKIHDLITTFSERLMKLKTWIDPLQSKPQIQAFFFILKTNKAEGKMRRAS